MAGRPLTDGEIDIVRQVFADSVDTSKIHVHNRRWLPLVQPRGSGMAPLGHLYMHGAFWRDDYAAAGLRMRAVFVHEVTHVWQYQNRVLVPLLAGAWQMIRTRGRYHLAYDYAPHPERDLLDYNLEQQARLIEDWYAGVIAGTALQGPKREAMAAVLARFLKDPTYPRHTRNR